MPRSTELDEFYHSAWCGSQDGAKATGGTDPELARQYTKLLRNNLGRRDFDGLRILDFGAGWGDMLAELMKLGAQGYAVDRYGIDGLAANGIPAFRTIQELPGSLRFHGIVSIDVIEHVFAPWQLVEQLRSRLEPGGWLYIATPNASSLSAKVLANRWSQVLNPVHLHLFTPRSMSLMLNRGGFSRIERLKWYVNYRMGPARHVLQRLLQYLGLDGELRYLAIA